MYYFRAEFQDHVFNDFNAAAKAAKEYGILKIRDFEGNVYFI